MEGTPQDNRTYYRCAARTIVPGAPLVERHPKNVYLPERAVLDVLNEWIGRVFAPEHRDETVDQLLASVGVTGAESAEVTKAKAKIPQARATLRGLQDAIKAGVNPVALVDSINEAQCLDADQGWASSADIDHVPDPPSVHLGCVRRSPGESAGAFILLTAVDFVAPRKRSNVVIVHALSTSAVVQCGLKRLLT